VYKFQVIKSNFDNFIFGSSLKKWLKLKKALNKVPFYIDYTSFEDSYVKIKAILLGTQKSIIIKKK